MKITTIVSKSYTTHMPMLIKVLGMTKGPVLELGGGPFSTPLLHWLCFENQRKLLTYEDNPYYFNFLKKFVSRNHRIRLITKDWKDIDLKTHWNVVFIDHTDFNEQRKKEAIRLKDKADYIIIHDTEQPEYDKTFFDNFKYQYHWKFATPNVSVVSNFIDLSNL